MYGIKELPEEASKLLMRAQSEMIMEERNHAMEILQSMIRQIRELEKTLEVMKQELIEKAIELS